MRAGRCCRTTAEIDERTEITVMTGPAGSGKVTLLSTARGPEGQLRQELRRWLAEAREAGLDDETIKALFVVTLRVNAGDGFWSAPRS
jgi:GntR family transcriptional regulator